MKIPSAKFVDGIFFYMTLPNMVMITKEIIIYDNFDLFEFIQLLLKEHPAAFRRLRIHPQVFD